MISRRYGSTVNVASIAGKEGNPTLIPYSSTKAAVICLTKASAKEVAGKGDITVNSISPAVVRQRF
jgi:3-oxoacyl-[acyl-carrier protein] reductase